jgi:hypothetical protein
MFSISSNPLSMTTVDLKTEEVTKILRSLIRLEKNKEWVGQDCKTYKSSWMGRVCFQYVGKYHPWLRASMGINLEQSRLVLRHSLILG